MGVRDGWCRRIRVTSDTPGASPSAAALSIRVENSPADWIRNEGDVTAVLELVETWSYR